MRPLFSSILAVLALGSAFSAHAIYINEQVFVAQGGRLDDLPGTVPNVFDALRNASHAEQFHAVGDIGGCTGTFLGLDGNYMWILTAAHCVDESALWHRSYGLHFWDRNDVHVAGGAVGWSFVHPNRLPIKPGHGGASTDIALLKVSRADFSVRLPVAPWIYDRGAEVGKTVTLVGNGDIGVGLQSVSQHGRGYRRAWGETVIDQLIESDHGFVAGYAPRGDVPPHWARFGAGDSGSAWWQQHDGAWTIIATTNGGADWFSTGARVSKYASWIKDLFPGARLFSERMRVTETRSFNWNYGRQAPRGFVLAPGQAGVSGPTAGIVSGQPGQSWIQVPVKNEATGATATITLKATRYNGCSTIRMEDAALCASNPSWSQLDLYYQASSNPQLPSGAWKGRVAFQPVGAGALDDEPIELDVDIVTGQRGRVTAHVPFQSANHAYGKSVENRPVSYVVPQQALASGPRDMVGNTGVFSQIIVQVRDAITQQPAGDVVLRAQRGNGCDWHAMNGASLCGDLRESRLKVWFDPSDNAGLRNGIYRGEVQVRAVDATTAAARATVQIDVNIDTLTTP